MGYLPEGESRARVGKVREVMESRDLDVALVYYDEFNIGNGWYLTGWCPQFESGAVMIRRSGEPLILGGPESEPFAKLDSSIKETRNFTVFMVPDEEYPNATITDFPALSRELEGSMGSIRRVGLVGGGRMPAECYAQLKTGFGDVELVDFTEEYVALRFIKSGWERDQIRSAFALADLCYDAMKSAIAPGVSEISVAAEGEYAARRGGASGFGFTAIIGSGPRSNAVVPTASSRTMEEGEMVMIGLSPKVNGYCGVIGDALPVSGTYSESQEECIAHLRHAFRLTKEQLVPGRTGREIDAPARAYFDEEGLSRYLICPFAHTIGLHEAESPFFGPGSDDELRPGMTVCIDVSFFGHPEWHGVRVETGYEITSNGTVPLSPKLDAIHTSE